MTLFRIQPAIPAAAMKTYRMVSPQAAQPVSERACARANCPPYLHGWITLADESDPELGQRQAHYIRTQSGRKFTEIRRDDGLTEFRFEAGQRCFGQHKLPREGAERFLVVGGDFRGNPRGEFREHVRPDDWVEDFAEHQDKIKTALERG